MSERRENGGPPTKVEDMLEVLLARYERVVLTSNEDGYTATCYSEENRSGFMSGVRSTLRGALRRIIKRRHLP